MRCQMVDCSWIFDLKLATGRLKYSLVTTVPLTMISPISPFWRRRSGASLRRSSSVIFIILISQLGRGLPRQVPWPILMFRFFEKSSLLEMELMGRASVAP